MLHYKKNTRFTPHTHFTHTPHTQEDRDSVAERKWIKNAMEAADEWREVGSASQLPN